MTDDSRPGGRRVDSPGVRAFGDIVGTDFDYDVSFTLQHGHDGGVPIRAHAFTAEAGWRARDSWDSRLGLFPGVATGDDSPTDGRLSRFEKFFGFGRPWSASDYIVNENIVTLRPRWEARRSAVLRFDVGWSSHWLESSTDRFSAHPCRKPRGLRAAIPVTKLNSGSAGPLKQDDRDIRVFSIQLRGFVRSLAGRGDTDFAYLEALLGAF